MPDKNDGFTVGAEDPEFWNWAWGAFREFIIEDCAEHVISQDHRLNPLTTAMQMAVEEAPSTEARDEAFFKLGVAWALYAQQKGIVQRVPKPGNPSLS
jgi:hypothetical protein